MGNINGRINKELIMYGSEVSEFEVDLFKLYVKEFYEKTAQDSSTVTVPLRDNSMIYGIFE